MRIKRYAAGLLTVCMIAGCLSGCGKKEAEVMSTGIHVDTEIAAVGKLEQMGNYIGTVEPNDSVDVTPMVSGTVKKVNVKVGDTVKEGDVLCQFDDTAAQLQLDSAKSAVNSAEAGKKSAKDQSSAASKQAQSSIDSMKDTLSGYQTSLKKAKQQMKKLKSTEKELKSGMETAQKAYTTTKTTYKTAENLYVNYRAFLNQNSDCQTTAGLTAALADAGADGVPGSSDKAKTAKSLSTALGKAGVTVEYLSDSGLTSLKGNMEDAESAYTTASGAYQEAVSGVTALQGTIDSLETQITATQKGIKSAEKTQKDSTVDTDGVYNAQIDAAQVGVESAEYQKDLYTITAPMSGVVEAVNVTENEMAATGYPAFTISGKKSMLVTFYVTEEVKDFLKLGNNVEVTDNGNTYRGSISFIGTAVDAQKGLFKAQAQIYVKNTTDLSTGISVNLSTVTQEAKNDIVIPYDAVYYEDNQPYVYCVEDGKAVRKDVSTGLYNEDNIVITEGISAGDEVVTSWASGLKEGAEILSGEETEEQSTEK